VWGIVVVLVSFVVSFVVGVLVLFRSLNLFYNFFSFSFVVAAAVAVNLNRSICLLDATGAQVSRVRRIPELRMGRTQRMRGRKIRAIGGRTIQVVAD